MRTMPYVPATRQTSDQKNWCVRDLRNPHDTTVDPKDSTAGAVGQWVWRASGRQVALILGTGGYPMKKLDGPTQRHGGSKGSYSWRAGRLAALAIIVVGFDSRWDGAEVCFG